MNAFEADALKKERAYAFQLSHGDVMSCRVLKSGLFSVRLANRTPWAPASHGLTPELAYAQAKLDRVTAKLMS
jgi:hypothetical protein